VLSGREMQRASGSEFPLEEAEKVGGQGKGGSGGGGMRGRRAQWRRESRGGGSGEGATKVVQEGEDTEMVTEENGVGRGKERTGGQEGGKWGWKQQREWAWRLMGRQQS